MSKVKFQIPPDGRFIAAKTVGEMLDMDPGDVPHMGFAEYQISKGRIRYSYDEVLRFVKARRIA